MRKWPKRVILLIVLIILLLMINKINDIKSSRTIAEAIVKFLNFSEIFGINLFFKDKMNFPLSLNSVGRIISSCIGLGLIISGCRSKD